MMDAAKTAPDRSHRATETAASKSHGTRLLAALEAVDALPANESVSSRLLECLSIGEPSPTALAAIAEQDPALAARLVRLANRCADSPRRGVLSTTHALEVLGPDRVRTAVRRMPGYTVAGSMDAWHDEVDRFRLHAIAVRAVATSLAARLGERELDRVAVVALLHDVGKLVLARVHQGYPDSIARGGGPNGRLALERESFGVDHSVIGGVVARRWGLPQSLSMAIAGHHARDAAGHAAIVQLADLLVHRRNGIRVPLGDLAAAAVRAGFADHELGSLLDETPVEAAAAEPTERCPLSRRQLEMIRGLSEGKQYKEIARGLDLSASTVRSHLHEAYKRLHVTDRAQAVLLAAERGWIGRGRIVPIVP